jgi:hypothetical protein
MIILISRNAPLVLLCVFSYILLGFKPEIYLTLRRAIALAVWSRVPTTTSLVRAEVRYSVGFVVDKLASRKVLSEYCGFPCQSFQRILYTHPSSSWDDTIGQIVVDVTQPQENLMLLMYL